MLILFPLLYQYNCPGHVSQFNSCWSFSFYHCTSRVRPTQLGNSGPPRGAASPRPRECLAERKGDGVRGKWTRVADGRIKARALRQARANERRRVGKKRNLSQRLGPGERSENNGSGCECEWEWTGALRETMSEWEASDIAAWKQLLVLAMSSGQGRGILFYSGMECTRLVKIVSVILWGTVHVAFTWLYGKCRRLWTIPKRQDPWLKSSE